VLLVRELPHLLLVLVLEWLELFLLVRVTVLSVAVSERCAQGVPLPS